MFMISDPWRTAFSLQEEHQISRNTLLTTLPLLAKEWRVSFDFKANNFNGLAQVLHLTAGGKGVGRGSRYGDRTPAIWTHSSRGFLVSSAVGGKYSYAKYFKALPSLGEWTSIKVAQELVGSRTVYSITIGGKKVFAVTNSKPAHFENVRVYASSDWYSPANGSIRNLLIQNKNYGELVLSLPNVTCVVFQTLMRMLNRILMIRSVSVEPIWSEWGACRKTRTRPQLCSTKDRCCPPPEVEEEQCQAGVSQGAMFRVI